MSPKSNMEQLVQYIKGVHAQVQKLNNPVNPVPPEEKLHSYVEQVVQSIQSMTQKAPGPIKDKIRGQFGAYWDYNGNKPSKTQKMTPLQLEVITSVLAKVLEQECQRSKTKVVEEQKPKAPKKFNGEEITKVVSIPEEKVGRLIGPQGTTMKSIEAASECRVQVTTGTFIFSGAKEGVDIGEKICNDLMTKGFSLALLPEGTVEDSVTVSSAQLPEILGVGWKNMKFLRKNFNVEIGEIDNSKQGGKSSGKGKSARQVPIPIAGSKEDIAKAKKIINDLATMGYSDVLNPEFVHEFVEVPADKYPRIIGSGGSEIGHIQSNFNVKVLMPSESRGINHKNPLVVGIAENVAAAVKYIAASLERAERAQEKQQADVDGSAQEYAVA